MAVSDKNAIISSYGLDLSSTTINWEGWTPNKKYTDKLTISNLNTKTINIKIESLPTSKYFKVNHNHDEIMKIRGGHSKKITISFRPLEIKHYSDEIILSIENKPRIIKISLNADIPKTSLQIPSIIDFGFIAVREESNSQFEMINNGDTAINFKWITTDSPLIFEPAEGVIDDTQTISIRYTPHSATCVEMIVPLQINEEQHTMYMTVKALCTYPFFKISSKVVDLGAISIGDCKKKKLRIENCSPVSSMINIRRDHHNGSGDDDMESVFTINPTKCRIEHSGFIDIDIQFKPRTVGVKYTEHCVIDTLCGYKVRFQINGKADSPKITTSLNLINFKSVQLHNRKTEVFTLTNYSSIDSHFEFINVGESEISKSSFILTPKRGKIFANQSVNITVHFKPNNAMLFNKGVYCIINHHIPLFIRLIGVGINDETKFVLEPKFDQLQDEIKNEIYTNDVDAAAADNINHTNMSHALFTKLFNMNSNTAQDVTLSANMIQFEPCSLSQGIAPYHNITLFNTNKSNLISIKWDVESSKTSKSSNTKKEFAVFPPFMDIRSLSSADFSAAFEPSMDLMYFYDKIDCYYHHKQAQNAPSKLELNCVSIDLFGNSFAKASNHFTAEVKLSTDRIEFTPCSLGSSIYATLKIRNLSSEHPAVWRIEAKKPQSEDHGNDPKHDVQAMFDFKPKQGYIPPNTFQLMVAKFDPSKQGTTALDASIIFNENKNMIRSLQLIGIAVEPKLCINNEIYAIPTCIGMTSNEYIDLYNASPIPIHYEWRIPSEFSESGCVTIEPMNGVLDINEKKKCILNFSPNQISSDYRIECECFYGNNESKMEYHETLIVHACCNQSIVEFIPKESDFGCILIDDQTTKSVFIQNNADCKLNCDFYIEPMEGNENNGGKLEIEPFINNCNIPPKTRKQLELNINAIYPGIHKYELIAEVKRIDGQGSINSRSNIKFNAVWPTLSVTDIQCSAQLQSKENLWSMFSVNALNKTFLSDLTSFERDWNNVNIEKENIVDQDHLDNILENRFTNICFNFGTQQENNSSTKIYMKVHNKGSIAAAINLKYITELQCTAENWATKHTETEQPLFDFHPSHFELEAHASTVLCFTYHPYDCDEHQTKILLSIQNGKQITLNLTGETVANHLSPQLSISYNTVQLKPQPIGLLDKEVGTQFIPVQNLSDHDLIYSVDTTSINSINEQNYNFKIFEVINVQGVIPRNASQNICIKFHPIEIKSYSFTLRINAEIDDKNMANINPEATFINIPITADGILQYDIDAMDETKSNETCFGRSYNIKDTIKLPQCNAKLSTEILHFGLVPMRANIRKIVLIYNEQKDYPVSFQWNKELVPYVSVKEMSGEIQPNSCTVCEICIRSELEPVVINECLRCLITSHDSQSILYLKVDCCVIADSQIERNCSDIVEKNVIQTDKPISINTSLLSPRSQKQMSKMRNEAEEVSIACCKTLLLNALNSETVQQQLNSLAPYKIPFAMDLMKNDAENEENTMLWKKVKNQMNENWNKKRELLNKTEFHDFLQYVIAETVFNVTAEMMESFDVNCDEIASPNMDKE